MIILLLRLNLTKQPEGKMVKKILIILVMMAVMAGFVIARNIKAQDVAKGQSMFSPRGQEKVVVRTSVAQRGDLNLLLSYVGSLKAKDEVNAYAKVSGKLVEYKINEGDPVNKGDVIAFLDRDETGSQYELARIDSPLKGVVGKIFLDKGASVIAASGVNSGTPIAVVLNMEEMIVRVNAAEADIPYIKRGSTASVEVDAYAGEQFTGQVTRVSEVVDDTTRTLPFEITIANADHRLNRGCLLDHDQPMLKDRLARKTLEEGKPCVCCRAIFTRKSQDRFERRLQDRGDRGGR